MRRALSASLALLLTTVAAAAVNQACSNDTPATGGIDKGLPGSTIPVADGGAMDSGKITVSDAGSDAGPPIDAGPALCDPAAAWTSNGRLPTLDSTSVSEFGAVGAEELSIAWTKANGDLFVADRADIGSDFSTANKVDVGATSLATGRVALSPTGRTLIAVASGGASFVEFDRASITSTTWTKASQDVFTQINAFLAETTGVLAEPVIGADKLTLYFVATLGTNPPFIYESRYNASLAQWASPNGLLPTALRGTATKRRRPTGASSDRRTLFFYDEVGGLERAAWRSTPDTAFTQFVDLTGYNESAPNAACDTLYFQGTDTGGAGIFTAQ